MTVRTKLWHLASRLAAWLRTQDLDRDFQRELDAHLTMLTDDNIRRGMPPDEARRAARLRLGAAGSLQAQHREARGLPGLDFSEAPRLNATAAARSAAARRLRADCRRNTP